MARHVPGTVFWLGLGYCATAPVLEWMSTIGLYRGIGVTPWNPAAGLALAFVFIFGRQAWPYVVAAELITALLLRPTGLSLPTVLLLSFLTSGVWIAGGTMLRSIAGFNLRLRAVQAVLGLLAITLICAFVHCALYIGGLWLFGEISSAVVVPASWRLIVGDIVGVLIVAPLPLLLHEGWRGPRPNWEHTLQLALLVVTIWTIFGYHAAPTYQLFYLLFMPVLWVAIREGISGATLVLNIVQLGLIIGAHLRIELVPSAGALQALMSALGLTGLLVGAVVSERQHAGQRLRDQHAAIGRVLRLRSAGETAAAIAHQLNQPLTAIATYASIAKDAVDKADIALARRTLASLANECDRAATVVRSVRDLVKLGSLTREPLKLQELIDELRRSREAECRLHDIDVEIAIPGNLPNIQGDRVQLEQAIDNLLCNSIEAIRETGRGGTIKISAGLEKGDTQISVEDDGPGFAPGLDAIATTPFMTTKLNGTGLGLAIARSVAEAHGGSLAVDQRRGGASVRIRLPAFVPASTSERNDAKVDHHH